MSIFNIHSHQEVKKTIAELKDNATKKQEEYEHNLLAYYQARLDQELKDTEQLRRTLKAEHDYKMQQLQQIETERRQEKAKHTKAYNKYTKKHDLLVTKNIQLLKETEKRRKQSKELKQQNKELKEENLLYRNCDNSQ